MDAAVIAGNLNFTESTVSDCIAALRADGMTDADILKEIEEAALFGIELEYFYL